MEAPDGGKGWHCLDVEAALAAVDATPDGLTQSEADRRREQFGPNVPPSELPPGWLAIGLRQLKSPLIYVLLAAAAVALALGDVTDAAFIGFVLLVNSALGGWQEWHAEQQSQGLQKLLRIRATVLRDGSAVEVDAEGLVPGDIVAIESGQRIPADLRLLDDRGLEPRRRRSPASRCRCRSLRDGAVSPIPRSAIARTCCSPVRSWREAGAAGWWSPPGPRRSLAASRSRCRPLNAASRH
jgi:Cation transporter/ATPase, N-terminus/E1-E2 ATPase